MADRARPKASRTGRRLILPLLFLLGAAGAARAQVGASLSLASEDRFRGEPLSQGRPVASLSLAYDAPEGLYAGASLTGVATAHSGARVLALQEYAGYARRTGSGLTLDLGVTNASYSEYYSGRREAEYQEVYVGLIGPQLSAHLHYSPDYFERGYGSFYLAADRIWRPTADLRILGHLGLLAPTESRRRSRVDWRLAVAREVKGLDLQAAWVGASARDYEPGSPPPRQALVVSLTHGF